MLRGTNAGRKVLVWAVVFLFTLPFNQPAFGISQGDSHLCDRDTALQIIQQQIAATKTFDLPVQRISVLLRASRLLWPHQQNYARAGFAEAFDLVVTLFREKGEQKASDGRLNVELPDQRFIVLSEIARVDALWARRLTEQMLKDDRSDGEVFTSRSKLSTRTGEHLLNSASNLLGTDLDVAISFARASLSYPANHRLTAFLYRLAELKGSAGDHFYSEALAAYRTAPINQLLYLSAYPFGMNRDAGETLPSSYYQVPSGFVANPQLQRLFIEIFLRRASQIINSSAITKGDPFLEAEQIWLTLTRLEPFVIRTLPHLSEQLNDARRQLFVLLSDQGRQNLLELSADKPKKTFEAQIETAEKENNSAKRDQLIALSILGASDTDFETLVDAAQKISDIALRDQLLSWLFFRRAEFALAEGDSQTARQLAAKIVDLDQRAYLYCMVVTQMRRRIKDDPQVLEVLDTVLASALKANDTEVKARSLLGLAHQYANIDPNRSISTLGEAVKSMNKIASPDFSRDYVIKKLETETFSTYLTVRTPGFDPENSFREISRLDFAGTLYQANNLQDKLLRSVAILATVEQCLAMHKPQKPSRRRTINR